MNSKAHPAKVSAKPKSRKRNNSDKGARRTDRCVAEFMRAVQSRNTTQQLFVEGSQTPSFEKAETPTMQSKFAASERDQEQLKKLLIENAQLKCKIHDLEHQAENQQRSLQRLRQSLESMEAELWTFKTRYHNAPPHGTDQVAKYLELIKNSLPYAPLIEDLFLNRIPSLAAFAQKAINPATAYESLSQTLQVIWDIAERERSRNPHMYTDTSVNRTLQASEVEWGSCLKQRIDQAVASTRLQLTSIYSRNYMGDPQDSFDN